MPYMESNVDGRERYPRFSMAHMKFNEPNSAVDDIPESVENVLIMPCQSGKSAELVWQAWCCFYILGAMPIILVRNRGGRIQGLPDMCRAVTNVMDTVIKPALRKSNVPEKTMARYVLTPVTLDGDVQTRRPRVIVALYNRPTLARLRKPLKSVNAIVTRLEPDGKSMEVAIADRNGEPLEPMEIRRATAADLRTGTLEGLTKGSAVQLKGPADSCILELFGHKGNKARVVLLADEGDLTVQSVHGAKAQGKAEQQMHGAPRTTARDESKEDSAVDEDDDDARSCAASQSSKVDDDALVSWKEEGSIVSRVLGSIFVTATPMALFMRRCSGTTCWLCGGDFAKGDITQTSGDCLASFHVACLSQLQEGKRGKWLREWEKLHGKRLGDKDVVLLGKGLEDDDKLKCPHCTVHEVLRAEGNGIAQKIRTALDSTPASEEWAYGKFTLPSCRLVPNIVKGEVPRNYIEYEEDSFTMGHKGPHVVRQEVPGRMRIGTGGRMRLEAFLSELKQERCPLPLEGTYSEIEAAALAAAHALKQHAEAQHGSDSDTEDASKHLPQRGAVREAVLHSKLPRTRGIITPEEKADQEAKAKRADRRSQFSLKYTQDGVTVTIPSTWRGVLHDFKGISSMIGSMLASIPKSGSAYYRHGLILTDKTRSLKQQRALKYSILHKFADKALVVATYNQRGIVVHLTSGHTRRTTDKSKTSVVVARVLCKVKGKKLKDAAVRALVAAESWTVDGKECQGFRCPKGTSISLLFDGTGPLLHRAVSGFAHVVCVPRADRRCSHASAVQARRGLPHRGGHYRHSRRPRCRLPRFQAQSTVDRHVLQCGRA